MRHELAKSTIGTRRLVLRPLRVSDAAAISALFNDWDVMRYLASPPWPYTRDDARRLCARRHEPGRRNGGDRVRHHARRQADRHDRPAPARAEQSQRGAGWNIGYWLGKRYWGQGYMTEALRAVVTHVFALTRSDEIYCGAFADNIGSLRVQRKVGFTHDGDTTLFSRPTGHELCARPTRC